MKRETWKCSIRSSICHKACFLVVQCVNGVVLCRNSVPRIWILQKCHGNCERHSNLPKLWIRACKPPWWKGPWLPSILLHAVAFRCVKSSGSELILLCLPRTAFLGRIFRIQQLMVENMTCLRYSQRSRRVAVSFHTTTFIILLAGSLFPACPCTSFPEAFHQLFCPTRFKSACNSCCCR